MFLISLILMLNLQQKPVESMLKSGRHPKNAMHQFCWDNLLETRKFVQEAGYQYLNYNSIKYFST